MAKKPMTRSENMSRIKGKDTSIELRLRKELWARGVRYRKTCNSLPGKPDICFKGKKIAIFCDSEYWHGKYLSEGRYIPKTNTEFWVNKIKRNMERDREINDLLSAQGWKVIRFWGEEINKELEKCVQIVLGSLASHSRDIEE